MVFWWNIFHNMRLFLWKLLHTTISLSGELRTSVQVVACINAQLRGWNPSSTFPPKLCPGSAQRKQCYLGSLQPWNFLPSIVLGDSLTHSYSPTVSFLTLGMPSLHSCHSIIAFLISHAVIKYIKLPREELPPPLIRFYVGFFLILSK